MTRMGEGSIHDVKRRYSSQLMALPSVVGVGVQEDEHGTPYIAVYADEKDVSRVGSIPATLEGYQVKVVPTGRFKAF